MLEPKADEREFDIAELARRLVNVVRIGIVHSADYETARVKVQYDETDAGDPVITGWLPWITTRAGKDRTWWAPDIGEQVVVLSPGGELINGVAMPAIYQQSSAAPATDPNKHVVVYPDGTRSEYDRNAHRLSVTVAGDVVLNVQGDVDAAVGGKVDLVAGGAVNVDAPDIHHNGGQGVVTGECVCHFTGRPHGDKSSTVTAGK